MSQKRGISKTEQAAPAQPPIKVFGSQIWPEVRTVCNIFDLVGRKYRVEQAGDIFTEAGQRDEAQFNPARAIPIVVINDTKILADPATLIRHVCRHYQLEQMYPVATDLTADRQRIDQILEVCFLHFKRTSDRLIKLILQQRAIAAGNLQLPDQRLLEQEQSIAYEKEVMIVTIQRTVDNWLNEVEDQDYLATEKVSAADLAVFQQLKQIFVFTDTSVDQEQFPELDRWYQQMNSLWTRGQIKGKDELEEIVEKLNPHQEIPVDNSLASSQRSGSIAAPGI